MAYFIVIGTNNDVKCVVDEMKSSHLQHNVITSGCIINKNDGLYYSWNVYNNCGKKVADSGDSSPIKLSDAFSNQIAQFKTLLPTDAKPHVFILCTCLNQDECNRLKMVCGELDHIIGTKFTGIYADIVILGYDINNYNDVTIRPRWRELESIKGLTIPSSVSTNILYLNNIDYDGAATNVDYALLGRFLCHWSKMVSAGGFNPKAGVNSVYSIGLSEHQYQLSNLDYFFKLSAEKILECRKINSTPSPDTQHLIDLNDFSKIDLGYHWLDGLAAIKKEWRPYCDTKWDWEKIIDENPHSLISQEYKLSSYLNKYLKLYIEAENQKINNLKNRIAEIVASVSGDDTLSTEENEKIAILNEKVSEHERNIENNTFNDVTDFYDTDGHVKEGDYDNQIRKLIEHLRSKEGKIVIEDVVKCTPNTDSLPKDYPATTVKNVGHAKLIEEEPKMVSTPTSADDGKIEGADKPMISDEPPSSTKTSIVSRVITLFKSWFTKAPISDPPNNDDESGPNAIETENPQQPDGTGPVSGINHKIAIEECIKALDKIAENRSWWHRLCNMVESSEAKISSCTKQMDEFSPKDHEKSKSLIDMTRVKEFRDKATLYKELTDKFLSCYFDKENAKSISDLIKNQILVPLAEKFHTLHWDGSNPFVKDKLSPAEIGYYVNYNLDHSTVFVEYVNNLQQNIQNNIVQLFYSNNKDILTTDPNLFRSEYSIKSNIIIPNYHQDFVNSLCVVQVLDIPNHIDSIKDFKPRRECVLSPLTADIHDDLIEIVGTADTINDKVKIIYDWICANIQYDTTKKINDADRCWKIRRGVCLAYCELFCYMAEKVGLSVEIIIGKAKTPQSKIADEKHAWLFVYTGAYDGIFIDPTWGAGQVENGIFKRNSDTSMWFDVSPFWMAFSHFPDDKYWTKTEIEISEEQFEKLPFKTPSKDNNGCDCLFECLAKT